MYNSQLKLVFVLTVASIGISTTGCFVSESPNTHAIHQATSLVDQGVLQLQAGELDSAEASFKVAKEIAEIPQSLDGLGCVAFLRGDLDRAERLFLRAYELDPTYSYVLGNLALLYEERGEMNRAAELYRSAIENNPTSFQFRNNFAVFLKQRKGLSLLARDEIEKSRALLTHPLIEANFEELSVSSKK